MTSDRVCALNGDDDNPDLDYYDDEDDLEAFSDADLGCEDGGTRVFPMLRKDTGRERARGRSVWLCPTCSPTSCFSIL